MDVNVDDESNLIIQPTVMKIKLEGRDVPNKPLRGNFDYSDELEMKGFLDGFAPHPLMLPSVKQDHDKEKAKRDKM